MKKLNLLFVALIAVAAGFLTSCDTSTDTVAPTITFTTPSADADTIFKGESYTFKGTVTADAEAALTEIKFFDGATELTDEYVEITDAASTYSFEVTVSDIQADMTFKVVAYDDQDNMTEEMVDIIAEDVPVTETTGVYMKAQDTSNDMCFDASTATAGTIAAIGADNIDLVLIYQTGDDRKHGLYAPSDSYVDLMGNTYGSWDWSGTHNATKVAFSNLDYANVTADDLESMTVSGTATTLLEVGDVVAFETVDGYKGILKITATALDETKSDANITFDVKVLAPTAAAK